MKDIINYVNEKRESNIVLTLGQAEDILAFIDNNKLTDKASKDLSGWYDILKSQVDKMN
jgi:hypothetical protein